MLLFLFIMSDKDCMSATFIFVKNRMLEISRLSDMVNRNNIENLSRMMFSILEDCELMVKANKNSFNTNKDYLDKLNKMLQNIYDCLSERTVGYPSSVFIRKLKEICSGYYECCKIFIEFINPTQYELHF